MRHSQSRGFADAPEVLPKILVVDDDQQTRILVSEFLQQNGFLVRTADSGMTMDRALQEGRPDLLILDRLLPDGDGMEICKRLAGSGMPILILSSLGSEADRIDGLEGGADDYLPKPFGPRELLARVRTVLRRSEARAIVDNVIFHFDGWQLSVVRRTLRSPGGRDVALGPTEFALLLVFLAAPQQVLSRTYLESRISEPHDVYKRMVDLQVSRLRRKLDNGSNGGLIETIRGEGYFFKAQVTRS